MATIKRFEELDCWQAGRTLKQQVYRLTRQPEFSRDLPLVSQIRRAACSVTSNIVEGFERNGNREFISFLSIAKGSCGEAKIISTPPPMNVISATRNSAVPIILQSTRAG